MNLLAFQKELPGVVMSDLDDGRFETVRTICRGMASARLGKVIYYACQHLDHKKEKYVEHGVWTGYTLACAGLDSPNAVLGIDPYDLEYGTPELNTYAKCTAIQNMKMLQTPATILQEDFRKVKWDDPQTIGVLFIDADHTYQDVIDSLEWAEPHLSNEAIIIFDDYVVKGTEPYAREVSTAITDWLRNHPKYQMEFCIRGIEPNRYVRNGFAIISYKNI